MGNLLARKLPEDSGDYAPIVRASQGTSAGNIAREVNAFILGVSVRRPLSRIVSHRKPLALPWKVFGDGKGLATCSCDRSREQHEGRCRGRDDRDNGSVRAASDFLWIFDFFRIFPILQVREKKRL